jgi:hypothetical protein
VGSGFDKGRGVSSSVEGLLHMGGRHQESRVQEQRYRGVNHGQDLNFGARGPWSRGKLDECGVAVGRTVYGEQYFHG